MKLQRRELAAVAGGLIALVGAYELGQLRAGYNSMQSEVNRNRSGREIAALQSENRKAREQVTRLQTEGKVDREAYTQVEQQLGELQSKLIEQQEELAFYRGIVGGTDQGGLRLQDFALTGVPAGVRIAFVLARAETADREVRGRLQIRVEGTRAGHIVSIDLATLAAAPGTVPLSFAFRYFQEITADLRIPADFTPQRVVIRILPATQGVKGTVESFPWEVRTR
jgi:hypothetical protein